MAPAAVPIDTCSIQMTPSSKINALDEYKASNPVVTEIEVSSDNIRDGGNHHKPSGVPKLHIASDYKVKEQPMGTIRPIRNICLAAGASGVNLAYQVQQRLRKTELVIYEKNPAVGGTW